VKRLTIAPGKALSLQFHHHRSEHWTVVQGLAEIICGDETSTLIPGQGVVIPVGSRHRLRNVGTEDVIVVEVQLGNYLGEDDIVRLEDAFGRVTPRPKSPSRFDDVV
jgi:mannose-6-phosphate isomerase-like protein (cupin superfamily)